MSDKALKVTLAIIVILALIAFGVILYKATEPNTSPSPNPPTSPPQGTGGALSGIISSIGGWFGSLFSNNNNPPVVDCDPNHIGYDKDGTPNPNCGKDYSGCDPDVCDPNRSGWNMCGMPDNRCY